MRPLVIGIALVALVAAAPMVLQCSLTWWAVDRARTRNRVQVVAREISTRQVTLICFVPRQSSWWGRA